MMNRNFFSIIIPTYNRADRIANTIQSVLHQTYRDFELIVVDDGSTDNTGEIVEKIKDPRIQYFQKENAERAAARNYGVAKATSEYVTFLDSDDVLYPDFLQNTKNFINDHKPDVFHIAYEIKDDHGNVLRRIKHKRSINMSILNGNLLSCLGVFIKKEIALKHHFHEERALSGSEDWLLWLQLAARYKILYSNNISAALIQHEDRSVMAFDLPKLEERARIFMEVLRNDVGFLGRYGWKVYNQICGHMYSYIALHAAIAGERRVAMKFILKSIRLNLSELFRRRTLAIIKHLL